MIIITKKPFNIYFFWQGGDIEKATDWIFNNPDASVSTDMDATTSENAPTAADAGLPDGGGSKYRTPVIIFTHTYVCVVYNTYMLRY